MPRTDNIFGQRLAVRGVCLELTTALVAVLNAVEQFGILYLVNSLRSLCSECGSLQIPLLYNGTVFGLVGKFVLLQ